AGAGISGLLQEIEVAERVSGLGLRGVAEEPTDVGIPFDVRPTCEVEVAPVGLRFTGERVLQVLVSLCPLQGLCHPCPPGARRSPTSRVFLSGTILTYGEEVRLSKEGRARGSRRGQAGAEGSIRVRAPARWDGLGHGRSIPAPARARARARCRGGRAP